ncbi:MAG: transglycosylase domain-containing protein [Gemmatimonadaceae bacterium]
MSVREWPAGRWSAFKGKFSRTAPGVEGRGWMRRYWKRTTVIALLIAGAITFDAWLFTCGFAGCPSAAELTAYRSPEGGRVLDRNGKLIGRLTTVNRVNVPLSRVPRHVRNAFVATEDRRFFSHDGIDWRGFGRSVVRNASALAVREGFSTITMQGARNAFLPERAALNRSFGRKFIELRIARLMERHLTKDQILELYLNEIYLGNGVYGVEAASRDLFGKGVRELSVAQGATLAALPKGPSAYTPKRHPDRAVSRRNLVLDLMRRERFLTVAQLSRAKDERLYVQVQDWRPPQPNESYALDAIRAQVDSVLRAAGEQHSELVVHTSLDLTAQRAAERAVRAHAARIQADIPWWENQTNERLQGAMVAIDPRTGDIRAMVGGRTHARTGFNRAVAARRQPGSAFKPFVYAAAISAGYTPATIVDDEPISIPVGDDIWSPANYGDEYRGPVTLRRALAQSANAATVRVSRAVGERRVVDLARRNGIGGTIRAVPAVALGALEVSPVELVTAYAPFANGGYRVAPRLVQRIERADKTVMWAAAAIREAVMDPRDAYQVTSMLRSVVDEGTGRAVRAMGVTGAVAGKTGTTNGGTDVWFVGYTPSVVAGFWFGYDTPRSMGGAVNGGRYAAPAWADFYRNGWRERAATWRAPSGLVAVDIDPESGHLAGEWCPTRRQEWFKAGSEPTEECDGHHANVDVISDVIAHWEEQDWRPLTKALRRLLER